LLSLRSMRRLLLRQTIPSVLALDYPAEAIEFLYIYESASTDRTVHVIEAFAGKDARIRPIRRETTKGGKAPITNDGIRQAAGEIIGIFDADHVLNADLVRQAVAELQNPAVGCVRGRCRIRNAGQNLIARLVAMERDTVERLGICGASQMGGFSNFGGGHGFFRREVFEKVGLFDEDILTEDIDFSVRLHLVEVKVPGTFSC